MLSLIYRLRDSPVQKNAQDRADEQDEESNDQEDDHNDISYDSDRFSSAQRDVRRHDCELVTGRDTSDTCGLSSFAGTANRSSIGDHNSNMNGDRLISN